MENKTYFWLAQYAACWKESKNEVLSSWGKLTGSTFFWWQWSYISKCYDLSTGKGRNYIQLIDTKNESEMEFFW